MTSFKFIIEDGGEGNPKPDDSGVNGDDPIDSDSSADEDRVDLIIPTPDSDE